MKINFPKCSYCYKPPASLIHFDDVFVRPACKSCAVDMQRALGPLTNFAVYDTISVEFAEMVEMLHM